MLKIGCVGVCQIHGIGLALAQLRPDAEIRVYDATVTVRRGSAAAAADYLSQCDVVFGHWLDEAMGELWTERLRVQIPKLVLLPVIGFAGWHPDVTYLIDGNVHYASPVGPYHSVITVSAYRLGYRQDEAQVLFNRLIFAELGYFEQYEASWNLLLKDLAAFGFAQDVELEEWRRDGPFMHTINHPKMAILARIARAAAVKAELVGRDAALPDLDFDLLGALQWPVYPEIGDELGITGNYRFQRMWVSEVPPAGAVPVIGLPQFISESYQLYDNYPAGVLANPQVTLACDILRNLSSRSTASRFGSEPAPSPDPPISSVIAAERTAAIAARDAALVERDDAVAARNLAVAEKDAAIEAMTRTEAERDALAVAARRWFEAVIAVSNDHNPLLGTPRARHTWLMSVLRRLGYDLGPRVLANRARDAGQWEKAVRYYRDALDLEPDEPAVWTQLALALQKTGKIPESDLVYQISRDVAERRRGEEVSRSSGRRTTRRMAGASIEETTQAP